MEIVPGLNRKKRFSHDLEVRPYLRDHHLEGRVILPAVESLIIMAKAVQTGFPDMEMRCLKNAVFSRFVNLDPDASHQKVFVDIENIENGGIAASFKTAIQAKSAAVSREIEHARTDFFAACNEESSELPFRSIHKLRGDCISIPAATIYRELVPFGEAFQNIVGDLSASPEGALAYISGGQADDEQLGSPFVLDAAMHIACVWGQRFAGVVSFPVGFEKRIIYQKTKKGEEYLGRVSPVEVNRDVLIFDAWIYRGEEVCEFIKGLKMADVTRGKISPPDWIKI